MLSAAEIRNVKFAKSMSGYKQEEVDILLTAVLARYGELYPDWEISTISIRRAEDRAEQIDRTIRMLQRMKNK